MKIKELIALIESDGWMQVRQRGSHRQFHHPTKPGTRLLNLSETVPALFSTFAPFSKVLKVPCIGGKSWMKVA